MKTENKLGTNSKNKESICYSSVIPRHKASKRRKNKGKKFCNFFKSSSPSDKTYAVNRKTILKIIVTLPMPKN